MQKECDELVISCLFPPSDYVSGITVAKRIIDAGHPVDVLQARRKLDDNEFSLKVNDYINNRILVDVACDNDWWECIHKFIRKGKSAIKKDYKSIYSRSWLMANHFLACEYKFRNNSTFWTAEFSDPLIYDLSTMRKHIIR